MVYSLALSPCFRHAEEVVSDHLLDYRSIRYLLDFLALHFGGRSMVSGSEIFLCYAYPASCPLNYFWLRASPAGAQGLINGKCTVSVSSSSQATSALNSAADFALLVVPAIALEKLKIDLNQKVGLIAIFMIGTL
jgi:hypothetical protein